MDIEFQWLNNIDSDIDSLQNPRLIEFPTRKFQSTR